MSELPLSKRARLTEEMSALPPAAAASSPDPSLKSQPAHPQHQSQPNFADVAYILGQSKALHFRQLAKTALLLSKEVSVCMFPNRSDLWVGLCRDRFGSEMMEQLREAKLLASEDDDDETAKGDRFERLFRMLAIKEMCKERSWAPAIPKDAQCLAAAGAPETKEGGMPKLKDLECKPENYWLVLQIFGGKGYDEAPLLSKVLQGVSLKRLLDISEHYENSEIEIDVDPITLANSERVDIISKARGSYGFDGDDCSTLLGPVHATVHLVRRTRDSKLEGLCIYSAGATGNFGGYYVVRADEPGDPDSGIEVDFAIAGAAIALEEGAKDCFDRLETGERGYFPDHAISTTMEFICEARTEDAGRKVDMIAKTVAIYPNLHAYHPRCGHCKCRACIGEDIVEGGELYSFNGVTFAHILENAKGWD